MHEAGDRDGCYLGGRRGFVGCRRTAIHLVLHRPNKRLPGSTDFCSGRLPAASSSRTEKIRQQEPADQRWATG